MDETHATKNYITDGGIWRPSEASAGVSAACGANGTPGAHTAHGAKSVIGGQLTFLPGATVEGLDGLMDIPFAQELAYCPPSLPASTAATVAALRDDYNRLLDALRSAGILAMEEPEQEADHDPDG